MLVGVESPGSPSFLDLDRHDLGLEHAVRDSPGGTGLAFESEVILFRSRYLMLARDVFGGNTHVAGAEWTGEGSDHGVHELRVAHFLTPPCLGHVVRRAAHAFCSACQSEFRIAKLQRLHRRNDGLDTGAAKPIHVHGGYGIRNSGLHGCNPRQVHVARFRVYDVAKRDMSDLRRFDIRSFHCGGRGYRARFNRRNSGKRTAERSNRRPGASNHHYFFSHVLLSI